MPGDWDSPKLRSPLLSLARPRFDSIRFVTHSRAHRHTHTLSLFSLSSLSLSLSVCLSRSFRRRSAPGAALSFSLAVSFVCSPTPPTPPTPDPMPGSLLRLRGEGVFVTLAPFSLPLDRQRCCRLAVGRARHQHLDSISRERLGDRNRGTRKKKKTWKSRTSTRVLYLDSSLENFASQESSERGKSAGKPTRPPPNLDLETHCGYKGSLHAAGGREPRLRGDGFF